MLKYRSNAECDFSWLFEQEDFNNAVASLRLATEFIAASAEMGVCMNSTEIGGGLQKIAKQLLS